MEAANGPALVVGGDSLVGAAIGLHCRERGMDAGLTSRRPAAKLFLDLREPDFALLDRTRYDFAFVCAAITDMRACQDDRQATRRINVTGTSELLHRLADKGTHAVFLSSSQVFDGEAPSPAEDAATCPKNEYGAQKLAVEQAINRDGLPVAILRVTKVLADPPVGLFEGWLKALARGEPIRPATNLSLSPVLAQDVARAAAGLAVGRHRGIWHLSARDEIVYAEAARLMATARGLPVDLVKGEALGEAEVPAIFRHRHTTLSSEKIARSLDMPLRRARDVVVR